MVKHLSLVLNRSLHALRDWLVGGSADRITAAEFEAKARSQGLVPIRIRKR